VALVSRCHKVDVIVRETCEGSYYACSKCHMPTNAIAFSVVKSIWTENDVEAEGV